MVFLYFIQVSTATYRILHLSQVKAGTLGSLGEVITFVPAPGATPDQGLHLGGKINTPALSLRLHAQTTQTIDVGLLAGNFHGLDILHNGVR